MYVNSGQHYNEGLCSCLWTYQFPSYWATSCRELNWDLWKSNHRPVAAVGVRNVRISTDSITRSLEAELHIHIYKKKKKKKSKRKITRFYEINVFFRISSNGLMDFYSRGYFGSANSSSLYVVLFFLRHAVDYRTKPDSVVVGSTSGWREKRQGHTHISHSGIIWCDTANFWWNK